MKSIIDELLDKISLDPSLIKRSGPRQDLGLLLFNERAAINQLWKAAERRSLDDSPEAGSELRAAVDKLRPLFGDRHR
jgi:hypothetical protein